MIASIALRKTEVHSDNCQILVLSPDRKSVLDIERSLLSLDENVLTHVCSEKITSAMKNDFIIIGQGTHVVLGSPGRLNFIFERLAKKKMAPFNQTKILFLVEIEKMLEQNFNLEIFEVIKELPEDIKIIVSCQSFMTANLEAEISSIFDGKTFKKITLAQNIDHTKLNERPGKHIPETFSLKNLKTSIENLEQDLSKLSKRQKRKKKRLLKMEALKAKEAEEKRPKYVDSDSDYDIVIESVTYVD